MQETITFATVWALFIRWADQLFRLGSKSEPSALTQTVRKGDEWIVSRALIHYFCRVCDSAETEQMLADMMEFRAKSLENWNWHNRNYVVVHFGPTADPDEISLFRRFFNVVATTCGSSAFFGCVLSNGKTTKRPEGLSIGKVGDL